MEPATASRRWVGGVKTEDEAASDEHYSHVTIQREIATTTLHFLQF